MAHKQTKMSAPHQKKRNLPDFYAPTNNRKNREKIDSDRVIDFETRKLVKIFCVCFEQEKKPNHVFYL